MSIKHDIVKSSIGWLIILVLFIAGFLALYKAVDYEARQDERRNLPGQLRVMNSMYIEAKYRGGK